VRRLQVVVVIGPSTPSMKVLGPHFSHAGSDTLLSEAVMYRSWNLGSLNGKYVTNDGNVATD
jgi:hypothetical protein